MYLFGKKNYVCATSRGTKCIRNTNAWSEKKTRFCRPNGRASIAQGSSTASMRATKAPRLRCFVSCLTRSSCSLIDKRLPVRSSAPVCVERWLNAPFIWRLRLLPAYALFDSAPSCSLILFIPSNSVPRLSLLSSKLTLRTGGISPTRCC